MVTIVTILQSTLPTDSSTVVITLIICQADESTRANVHSLFTHPS